MKFILFTLFTLFTLMLILSSCGVRPVATRFKSEEKVIFHDRYGYQVGWYYGDIKRGKSVLLTSDTLHNQHTEIYKVNIKDIYTKK